MKDLAILCADNQQEAVVRLLIERRRESLRIRNVTYEIYRGGTDGTVRSQAHELLKLTTKTHAHGLVILDCAFDNDHLYPSEVLRSEILKNLHRTGWHEDNSEVVAIHPELEVWLWANSPKVARCLGMNSSHEIRDLGIRQGWWMAGSLKPHKPKELLEAIQRKKRMPRSPGIAERLICDPSDRITIEQCEDIAFKLLCETLRRWFPAAV